VECGGTCTCGGGEKVTINETQSVFVDGESYSCYEPEGEWVRVCVGKKTSPSVRYDNERPSHAVVTMIRRVGGDFSGGELEDLAIR
jgi:hypothetical protein